MPDSLIKQLKLLVEQLDDGKKGCKPACPAPCATPCCAPGVGCPPCPYPYAQVCMFTPPVIPAPTAPKYVKPLRLPCPPVCQDENPRNDPEENFRIRYSNFYNNYNIDHRTMGKNLGDGETDEYKYKKARAAGVTVDGRTPVCEVVGRNARKPVQCDAGCPTGFKPCSMKLTPPPCCDPLGTWCATIQPCPPKPKKRVSSWYTPGKCKRPCCKHWKPKDGPCVYDLPCKAHCYDHPIGIKPTHNVKS